MKGKVINFVEKRRQSDNSPYLSVNMQVGDDVKKFFCTDQPTQELVKKSEGQEIEFSTFPSKDGSATFMSISSRKGAPGGGGGTGKPQYQPSKDASFALAYSKDILVAFIAKGLVEDNKMAKVIMEDYFDFCMRKLDAGYGGK